MTVNLEQIDELKAQNLSVDDAVAAQLQQQHAEDQSRIAWVIVWSFVLAVGAIFVLVFGSLAINFSTESTGDSVTTAWKGPAEFLAKTVSSVLLPIVTLVLGYYFGKEKG